MGAAVPLLTEAPQRTNPVPRWTVPHEVSRDQPLRWTYRTDNTSLFSGLDVDTAKQIQDLVTMRIHLRKGVVLFRAATPFTALYAIQAGSLKTVLIGEDGEDQVAGYHMVGDVIGLDGIGSDVHDCEAIALEESEVCSLPFDRVEQTARDCPAFQRNFHRYLSREIARQSSLMLLLGTMPGEKRLATFFLELAQRYQARGYSSSEFLLRMTRQEIGSYLGLQIETVSRLLARLHEQGLIHVQGRAVKLLDRAALKQLAHTGWRRE
jgi:CRP/FNR family transcriptional regulator